MEKSVNSLLCACLLAVTAVSLCGNLCAQSTLNCTYALFKYPGTRTTSTAANGVNKYGTIVGTAQDQTGAVFGFIRYANGSFQAVTIPNTTDLRPMDINDSGVISGATGAGGPIHVHGFWLSGSNWLIADDPDYPSGSTELMGLNNRNEFVGDAYDSNGTAHPILLIGNSSFFDLKVPNAVESVAQDISDSNVVVGFATIPGGGDQAFAAQCQ